MNEERNMPKKPHNLVMNDRKSLSLSGVEEVVSCDENMIVMRTVMGELSVMGVALHIGSFNRDNGDLKLDGAVKELVYADIDTERRGFFSRLLR